MYVSVNLWILGRKFQWGYGCSLDSFVKNGMFVMVKLIIVFQIIFEFRNVIYYLCYINQIEIFENWKYFVNFLISLIFIF